MAEQSTFPMTVFTPITPSRRARRQRSTFRLGANWPSVVLAQLGFIHIAHWAGLDRLPHVDPRQPPDPLPSSYLLFISHFNGAKTEYIEMFSDRIARRIGRVYRSATGFPGPVPAAGLIGYVDRHAHDAGVFYSAYPDASTRIVQAAMSVRDQLARLRAAARQGDPVSFRQAWTDALPALAKAL